MLTEVRDCDLLIVVTSSTFLKEKTCKKKKVVSPDHQNPQHSMYILPATDCLQEGGRLPGDIIFRLRLHQNLDPVDRDSESRGSILCGILLFPPPSAHAAGLIGLSTPWMAPSLWMVVQICPPLA